MNKEIEQKAHEISLNGLHGSTVSCMLEFAQWLGERWAGKVEGAAITSSSASAHTACKTATDLIREDLKS